MGYGFEFFPQAGLTFEDLTSFQLVILDNLDGRTNQITDNTVDVLQKVFEYGIPLQLIGDGLAAATPSLGSSQQTEWTQLPVAAGPRTGRCRANRGLRSWVLHCREGRADV